MAVKSAGKATENNSRSGAAALYDFDLPRMRYSFRPVNMLRKPAEDIFTGTKKTVGAVFYLMNRPCCEKNQEVILFPFKI